MPDRKMVEKLTRYEFIKKLKTENVYTDLIASGLMSINVAMWFDVYEIFLSEVSVIKEKYSSVTATSDILNNEISERQIYRIIKFMEN